MHRYYNSRCQSNQECNVILQSIYNPLQWYLRSGNFWPQKKEFVHGFRCDGQTACSVTSSSKFAGSDPCIGTTKYTEVVYKCIW
jgi:hypothetical protein